MVKKTDEEIEAEQKAEEEKIKADEDRIQRLSKAADDANVAAQRLDEATTRAKMGGRAEITKPESPKEITDEEYAKEALKGNILK